jgi:transglutaminase-like putative cysteine protease
MAIGSAAGRNRFMRAFIQFQLQISHAEPVRAVNQALRLTPRGFDGQEIKDWRVEVEPDARMRRTEDAFGNLVHSCTHEGPIDRLTVCAEGEIETYDVAGVVNGLAERFPLTVFLRDLDATHAGKELLEFAHDVLAGEADPLARMHVLMAALHDACAFAPGETPTPRAAQEVFESRAGSAREIAQVFVAAARSLGAPARFISGFFLGEEDARGAGAHHAWAEIHVEPIGWIGFDAALGFCPRDQHLRIAQGLDYFGAAPRRAGSLGVAHEDTRATLNVNVGQQASWQIQQ